MADRINTGADTTRARGDESNQNKMAEKRKSSDAESAAVSPPKKISISLTAPKPVPIANQKISFNLASSGEPKPKVFFSEKKATPLAPASAPIKLSLGSSQKPKVKESPPVLTKSVAAANVFDDSDDSDEEEMPPEAKMRMKNIGRDTPTASGPNSYGKGKQGFIDRQKIIEKQLKEEMEKVSGDKH